MAVAPLLLALIEQQRLRQVLRQYATLYGTLVGGFVAVLLVTVIRNRPVSSLLGGYEAATSPAYSTRSVLHYLLYHAAELDLSLGVVPFALLLALWFSPRLPSRPTRIFVAATFAVVAFLIVEVSAFASANAFRIEERDLFYIAPLALIASLRLADDGDGVLGRRPVLAAVLVAAGLPFFLPFQRFLTPDAVHDSFGLLPWWWLHDQGVAFGSLRSVALGFAAACAALALVPRPFALVVPALVAFSFVATTALVEGGEHGLRAASRDARAAGIGRTDRDWVDRAVTPNASVAYVRTGFGELLHTLGERVLQPKHRPRLQPDRILRRRPAGNRGRAASGRKARRGRPRCPCAVRSRRPVGGCQRRGGRPRPGRRDGALPHRWTDRPARERHGALPQRHRLVTAVVRSHVTYSGSGAAPARSPSSSRAILLSSRTRRPSSQNGSEVGRPCSNRADRPIHADDPSRADSAQCLSSASRSNGRSSRLRSNRGAPTRARSAPSS